MCGLQYRVEVEGRVLKNEREQFWIETFKFEIIFPDSGFLLKFQIVRDWHLSPTRSASDTAVKFLIHN